MWICRRASFTLAYVAAAACACALVLAIEARREVRASSWTEMSSGLGIGSQAGLEAGFFAFDARLESAPDGRLAPLPGFFVDSGPGGVLTLQPVSRSGSRKP